MAKKKQPKQPRLTAERLQALLQKKYGREAAVILGQAGIRVSACPVGFDALDRWVIGVGGIPYGRVTEVYGEESSGKTTIMNRVIAAAQRDGAVAVLVETEHAYDPTWAAAQGVNVDDVLLIQPSFLEEGVAEVTTVVDGAGTRPVMICWDSVAATPTQQEFEEGVDSKAMAEAPRIWSKAMRSLCGKLDDKQVGLVLVNQTRSKVGVVFGNPKFTSGGVAIKFHASLRLEVMHGKRIDEKSFQGRYLSVRSVKNKMAPPFRFCRMKMSSDGRFDDDWSVLDLAKELGKVPPSCTSVGDARKALGWEAA